MNSQFEYDVFLSYRTADQAIVHPLAERLREAGLRVWLDAWVIPAGGDIFAEIETGLRKSRVCVACMSPSYFTSEWTQLERNTAIFRDPMNNRRRFVPLLLADCDIPDTVRRLKYIDYRTPNEDVLRQLTLACLEEPKSQRPRDEKPIESAVFSLGHAGSVNSVAVTPDGAGVVSGSSDQTVRLWDIASGQCVSTFEGHPSRVMSVAVSRDGNRVISASEDYTIHVWDLASGRCTAIQDGLTDTAPDVQVAFSADGTRAVSACSDYAVRIWDITSAQCLGVLEGHSANVRSVAVSQDDRRAVSGSEDQTIRVWDLNAKRCLATLEGHTASIWCTIVNSNGTRAISGSSDETVRIWDLVANRCLATLEGHTAPVRSVAITPDGTKAISGSYDQTIRIWDLNSGTCLGKLDGPSAIVLSVAFGASGANVISGWDDNRIRVWNLATNECTAVFKGHAGIIRSMAISADGTLAVSGAEDQTACVWDISTGQWVSSLNGHSDYVRGIAISADATRAVSGSDDQTVRVWDLATGECLSVLEGHTDFVRHVAIDPGGKRAVSGSSDHTLRVWDVEAGKGVAILEGHSSWVLGVAITADGSRAISGSRDRAIRVWDLTSGECLSTLEGHSGDVWSVAASSGCDYAVSGSADNTVRVWDLASGRCLSTLEGHSATVTSVAINLDGSRVVSGSIDQTVRVWDRASGDCLLTLEGHSSSVQSVAVSPDGSTVYSVGYNGVLRIWSAQSIVAAEETKKIESQRRYTNAKVVLVGDSGVGKSGLAHRLIEDKFVETHSTHGMQVWRIDLPLDDDDGLEREALLWDLAGQKDYRLIHQLFLDETALALVLIDPQKDDPFAAAADWCKILSNVCKRAASRVLVASRVDVGAINVGQAKIDRFLSEYDFAGYLETSAKRGDNCSDRQAGGECSRLKTVIASTIPWPDLPFTSTPETLARLKNAILDMTELDEIRLLRFGELFQRLQQRLPEVTLQPKAVRSAVNLLSNHGLVMPLEFGDLVLLRPDLLNGYGGSVINAARANKDEIGSVREEDLFGDGFDFSAVDRLERSDEQLLLRAMLQTFLEKSLCLREQIEGGEHLVFPSQYRRERTFPAAPEIFVSYTFSGELQTIYTTLVVRLWYSREFDNQELWKDAAEFRTREGVAGFLLNRLGDGAAALSVFFDDDVPDEQRAVFLEFIHRHLKKYAGDLQRDRRYVCPNCNEPVQNAKAVRARLAKGGEHIPCQFCDELVPLIDSIEAQLSSDPIARKVLEMDEAAGIELSNQALEQILIGHMMTICGNANQIFRPATMADYGIDGEIEFRDNQGQASGRKIYVQLKCGGSHLRHRQRDETEVFDAERRHLEYWTSQPVDVYLVIRDSEKAIRWMNVTRYLVSREDRTSRQIVFDGEEVTTEQMWQVRDRYLEA